MKLSDEGLRLICSFEGYHTKQEDGSCKAYRCPAGVWTCGWGCTEGVDAHTHWSEAEAKERYRKELEKFEAAVLRHVKVPLNQNEFDALVSFSYNCGEGALQRSTLLKKLNAEKRTEAAKQFASWNKGGGRVLKGLVARRAREAALFLKPIEKPEEPYMPQSVEASKEPQKPATVAAGTCAAGGLALPFIPSIPTPPVEAVASVAGWQNAAETLTNFAHSPGALIAICGILIAIFAPMLARRFA